MCGQLWRQFGPRVPSVLCLHLFLTTHRGGKHKKNPKTHTNKPSVKTLSAYWLICTRGLVRGWRAERLEKGKELKTTTKCFIMTGRFGRDGRSLTQGRHQEKNIQTAASALGQLHFHHFTSRNNVHGEKTSSNLGLFTCHRGSLSWQAQLLPVKIHCLGVSETPN